MWRETCVGISKIWNMWWTMIYQQGVLLIIYYLIWRIATWFLDGWWWGDCCGVQGVVGEYNESSDVLIGKASCCFWWGYHLYNMSAYMWKKQMHYYANNLNTASISCNLKWTLHLWRAAKVQYDFTQIKNTGDASSFHLSSIQPIAKSVLVAIILLFPIFYPNLSFLVHIHCCLLYLLFY